MGLAALMVAVAGGRAKGNIGRNSSSSQTAMKAPPRGCAFRLDLLRLALYIQPHPAGAFRCEDPLLPARIRSHEEA